MAQIPDVHGFGQVAQSAAGSIGVPQQDASSGLNGIVNAASEIQQQQNNAKATLALATATNAAHDAHQQVTQGLMSGEISPQDAQSALKQRLDDIQQTQSDGLPPAQAVSVRAAMVSTTGDLSRQLSGTVFKYQQSETAATIDALGSQLLQDAARRGPAAAATTYDSVMDMTGASAGFSPEQMAAKKMTFRQSTTHGYYDDASTAMYAAGDQHGIASMLEIVAGNKLPEGEILSQEQRAHLTTKLIGFNSKLLADQARAASDAEREQIARENTAADALNSAQKIILNGQYLDQPTLDNLATVTTGTKQEQPARGLLAAQPHIVAFASQPADQRAALLEHYRSEASNPNVGTSPANQLEVAGLQAIDSKANELAKDDPWKAAQTYGVITNAPQMNMGDVDNALPLLDSRMQQISKVEAWVGHKVSPLQPAEAEQLRSTLKGMPPAQAASALSVIGQMVGDPDRIHAVAKQLDDRDNNFGLAMSYAGDRSADGQLTGQKILEGALALKNKTSMVDQSQQTGWKATIFKEIHGAFSSQGAEDSAVEAAYKITAANGGDTSAAITAATGGIITHGLGKIPLPINMDESTFDKRLSGITPAMLQPQATDGNAYVGGAAIPLQKFVSSLPDATLVHAGQGMYVVKAGSSFVMNAQGQRIVLRITQ